MLRDMLKKNYKFILLAVIALIGIFGVSYAFFEYYGTNKNSQLIFGNIYLKLDEGTSTLSVSNIFPETKEEARKRTDNTLTFSIKGLNTTENKDIWYEIMLTEGDDEEGKVRFNPEDLVFDLIEVDADGNETLVVDALSFEELNSVRIWTNTVPHNVTTEINQTYKLRVWLNENVTISDTNPNATYKASDFKSMYTNVKIAVFGNFVEKRVVGYINYNVEGYDIKAPSKTPIYVDTPVSVTTEITKETTNNFRGWSTTTDGEVAYYPGDIIEISDVVDGNINLYPYFVETLKEAIELDLPNNLQAADSDGNRYLTGNESTSNYLWYSGKLWRIVSINNDGSIKLVTQGNMTTVSWDTSGTNTDYSTSQIRKWLNEEFLPTLANADTVLANSTWDYTTYAEATITKAEPTAYVENEKVGLLTIYDYYKARNGLNSNFLNNGYFWWTMSPQTDDSMIWCIGNGGDLRNYSPIIGNGYSVRPSVNLKSNILIMGGDGTKLNPYVIEGDKATGVTTELLNNRISGEYINFNGVLYRIVGIEEMEGKELTKITMADYGVNYNTLTKSIIISGGGPYSYNPTYGIGLYLEEWYQADSKSETYANTYIKDNYKAMIATAKEDKVVWHVGPTTTGGFVADDYTISKTGDLVSATIGLGYYGEIFSSQFGEYSYSSTAIWLITSNGYYSALFISNIGSCDSRNLYTEKFGIRPSLYLRSDVKIVSGSGQPSSPYEISQ